MLLNNVGLKLKTIVQSGSTYVETNWKLSGCALDYLWELSIDIMGIKCKFNPSKKLKEVYVKLNLTVTDLG